MAVETAWRRTQSCANPSPLKFPANRDKYREFANWPQPIQVVSCPKYLILDSLRFRKAIQTSNLTGNFKGHISEFRVAYQGIWDCAKHDRRASASKEGPRDKIHYRV